MKYSDDLTTYTGHITSNLDEIISELKSKLGLDAIPILDFNVGYVAIPLEIKVDIPPKGAVGAMINAVEPVLLIVTKSENSYKCPSVKSDRKDFPVDDLSHLYAAKEGSIPSLCLVRNAPNEWYAHSKIADLLDLIREWFWKAATGRLDGDGNEYDPMRLNSYQGTHLYKYDDVYEVFSNKNSLIHNGNFAIFWGSIILEREKSFVVKSYSAIPYFSLGTFQEAIGKVKYDEIAQKPVFTIVAWSEQEDVHDKFMAFVPRTLGNLIKIGKEFGIDVKHILQTYIQNDLSKCRTIPILFGVKRPLKMIGYSGDVEFFNFRIVCDKKENGELDDSSVVYMDKHIEPFTSKLGQQISGKLNNQKIAFLGAGSLGSKILMHQARNGNMAFRIYDEDEFLVHNLARHVLFSGRVGQNKAEALESEIKEFYQTEAVPVEGKNKNITSLTMADFADIDVIVDSTASLNVQNWLCNTNEITSERVIRVEIAHLGQLGLLYREGNNRNPRIDDLVNFTYFLSLAEPTLQEWREYDMANQPESLSIGLGCSSTTMVASDDDISYHAALFSKFLFANKEIDSTKETGSILITNLQNKVPFNRLNKFHEVPKFDVIQCQNGSGWELRFLGGLTAQMIEETKRNGSVETGGVLMGIINSKAKTIHVLELIDAPSDSVKEPCSFYRGIENLPEQVDEIKKKTGNMIGYVGEWHSHPMGLDLLSSMDKRNIEVLKKLNDEVPIPTCSIIVSNNKVLPFVFN